MDENNNINEDLTNIITSFEKRTQQISEEQREGRERFVVALSELSRQYDLLREWTEKNSEQLKDFLEKLGKPKEGDELPQVLSGIAEKIENIPQGFANIVKLTESVETIAKNFSKQLGEVGAFSNEIKDSLSSSFSVFNDSIEKLLQVIKDTNIDYLEKQNEMSGRLLNKIDDSNTSFKNTLTGLQDKIESVFDKIEKVQLEPVEKQVSIFPEIQKELHSLTDGISVLQERFKVASENIEIASKKQDVISAVIDKRGEGIEGKIGLLDDAIKKFNETSIEKSGELKTAISELSLSFRNQIKPLEKILKESDKNRKAESEKMIKNLSSLPEQLNKYLDSNKKILDAVEKTQSSIGSISKAIEDLTSNIIENEKRRKEEEITEMAHNHLSRGVILFYRGSHGAAEKEIKKALELKNDFAEAYLNLGMVLGETGKPEKAIEHIKKALEIEPGLEEAYNNLGVIQLRGEKYEEAVESFNEAIKLGFKYPLLYLNMAKALIGLDRINEAVDSLKKVTEIDPTNAEAKELLSTYEKDIL